MVISASAELTRWRDKVNEIDEEVPERDEVRKWGCLFKTSQLAWAGHNLLGLRRSPLPQCPLEVWERVGKRPSLGKVLLGDVTAHVESRIDLGENG